MEVLILTVFVSLVLVAGALIFFAWNVRQINCPSCRCKRTWPAEARRTRRHGIATHYL
jgi:hypothetical protein